MKIVAGIAGGFLLLATFVYSFSGAPVPEKPDAEFDYHNASYAEKTEWMRKFANRFIYASETAARQNGNSSMTPKYKVDPNERQLIVTLTPVEMPPVDARKISDRERTALQTLYKTMMLDTCKADIKKISLVADTGIVFRIKTNLTELPLVDVEFSRESCENHHKG